MSKNKENIEYTHVYSTSVPVVKKSYVQFSQREKSMRTGMKTNDGD